MTSSRSYKQSLVAEVVSHVLEGLLADLQESSRLVAERPLDDAIRAWIAAMFAAVEKRRGVVSVIMREVPFLWEIPAVDRARTRLLDLAVASSNLRAAALGLPPLSAATIYLLTTMTGAAVLEAVLRPPPQLPQDALVSAVADIVDRVAGRPPRARRGVPRRPPRHAAV